MDFNLHGFRQFFEDMDPSVDKKIGSESGRKMDYLDGLGEEMGMEWEDIAHSLENEPWVSAHFSLGDGINYKRSAWQIVKGSLNHNGADIILKPQKGDRSYLKGNRLNKSTPDTKRYHLNRQQLLGFLTGGWSPAIQNAAGGMGGSMPGMGGM